MTGQGDLNSAIADLWARQRPEMLRRVDIVEDAVASLLEAELLPEQQAEAEGAAHKIAGSAGSFGFDQASEHAREIEMALRGGVTLEDAPRLSELVLSIRRQFGPDTAATRERAPSTSTFDAAAFTPTSSSSAPTGCASVTFRRS